MEGFHVEQCNETKLTNYSTLTSPFFSGPLQYTPSKMYFKMYFPCKIYRDPLETPYTFYFNIKSSLLILLFTPARLCEGTPLQPLRLDFFGIDFPSHPRSQLPFLTFCGQAGQQNKGKVAQIPWVRSATQPSHPIDISPPPHLPSIPCQVNIHAVTRHFASLRAAGRIFPLHRAKYFHRALTLFFPLLLMWTTLVHNTPLMMWLTQWKTSKMNFLGLRCW